LRDSRRRAGAHDSADWPMTEHPRIRRAPRSEG